MSIVNCPAWPPRIVLDEPFGDVLDRELRRLGVLRPFVLASRSLRREGGPLAVLSDRIAGIHAGVPQHSPQPAILAAAAKARDCAADAVVSIGGGSVVDAGKLVQAALAEGIVDVAGLQAWRAATSHTPQRAIPHIAVPTTLSGAEFTWFAGARNVETGLKEAFAARWMVPSAIIFDPELARHTPLPLWLSTGVRSIDHAVETLCAEGVNPLARTLCLDGLRRMVQALERTAADPQDAMARSAAQAAAWFCAAGLMSGTSMGASHAFGHVLGALFDVPHGVTSCVMLPAVMAYNGAEAPDRLALCAEAVGPDPAAALRRWIQALGLPTRLCEIGVGPEHRQLIHDALLAEPWLAANPRPILCREDIEAVLDLAE